VERAIVRGRPNLPRHCHRCSIRAADGSDMSAGSIATSVSVTIITHNSATLLQACLDSIATQTWEPSDVIVIDNASQDDSMRIARRHPVVSKVDGLGANVGFAAGQNLAIARSNGEWILTLNPDVVLTPTFIEALMARAAAAGNTGLGSLCGKLLRLGADGQPLEPPLVDSTGLVFTRSFRHLDRGSEQPDRGEWEHEEEVFGASAAAALYRRAMIEDLSIEGEFFDEAFFVCREDADVAWRAQLLGWSCRYVPAAVGYHVRRILPSMRANLPAFLNRHSVKNRFLMRIKNADAAVWRRCGWRGVGRDMAVVGGCLAWEWRSIPAFWDVVTLAGRAWRQRAQIQARRRRGRREIADWFE
jgi:GT2 family glycosyltransferase